MDISTQSVNRKEKRRRLVVHVIGTSEGAASNERPLFGLDVLDKEIVEEIRSFHISANNGTWGKVY